MTETARHRNDPRREATRQALIDEAERLFAEQGFDAVSTRAIGAAIGARNTNVVAYHFDGKDALIAAVLHSRLPQIDARRGAMLDAALATGTTPDIAQLMQIFAWPLFEQTDSMGHHSYARFLGALERSDKMALRGLVRDDYPHSERLSALMRAQLPPALADQAHLRMRLSIGVLVGALQRIDRDPAYAGDAGLRMFRHAIAMAAAAYAAMPDDSKGP